jgi:hypothetical protein
MAARWCLLALVIGSLAAGCFGGAGSSASDRPAATRPAAIAPKVASKVEGRVFTAVCVGRSAARCAPTPYRGSLVFCRTMSQIGLCPSARVDRRGDYEIELPGAGRFALIPAPGRGNVVFVRPRWVVVSPGQTLRLDIDGGNLMLRY